MLQDIFHSLCRRYTMADELIITLWQEIEQHYSEPHRHYHSFEHIKDLYHELQPFLKNTNESEILLFAVFYHDIIYNVPGTHNEEKSADLAAKRLGEMEIEPERIELCKQMILATKTHSEHLKYEVNLFTDADLAILGKDGDTYRDYAARIAKEYSIYPSLLYKNGRKNVLKHFLNLKHIYKTAEFRERYEAQARKNLESELADL